MNGITKTYTIWCNECSEWEYGSYQKLEKCVKEWKAKGWKVNPNKCPKCTNKA